ncbi:MAG: hypothetical protein M3Q12_01840 [Pseudomonadota bacterium]|uniref:hypothetical protein n=1 Tax=Polaromonas sp. TaxID=1869339 RepID=UPI001804753E|nr:hypothetical protein [Polaromonas sp.]MBA3595487.1 hypothetical protein [Polaromonas sp.]MDQ3270898.1 hypothetical protein [Pseudomonadota bacterium]
MALDWLFYWMTEPRGLAAITLAVTLPFILWRLVLGKTFRPVGFKPLVAAYALAALGLLTVNFATSHIEFSARVADKLLQEAQRWSIVPGWTVYVTVISLLYVLPLLGLVAVPVSALLLRLRRLSLKTIVLAVLASWLTLALIAWSIPTDDWDRGRRLESLTLWLTELAPGVVLVALPFLLGVYLASRRYRHAQT